MPDASLSPSNSLSALSPSMMLDRGAATADAITENDPLSKWAQRAEMEREAARTPGKTSHHQRWLLGLQNNAPPPPLASSTPQNSLLSAAIAVAGKEAEIRSEIRERASSRPTSPSGPRLPQPSSTDAEPASPCPPLRTDATRTPPSFVSFSARSKPNGPSPNSTVMYRRCARSWRLDMACGIVTSTREGVTLIMERGVASSEDADNGVVAATDFVSIGDGGDVGGFGEVGSASVEAVSYTHLTLPTILLV